MIIKGKTKADIARQIGISRQCFCEKVAKGNAKIWLDDDFMICYDYQPKNRNIVNYDPTYTGEFITRPQYRDKYNVPLSCVAYMVRSKKLCTSEDGKLVADVKIVLNEGRNKKRVNNL